MDIYFYSNFAKRENSTKLPPIGSSDMILTGYLKEPCSIVAPVFKIKRQYDSQHEHEGAVFPYTYAWINHFGRYYFVKDWVWADGLWEVHMIVDVLASFKVQIGMMRAYISRTSATTYQNQSIVDTMYPSRVGNIIKTIPFRPAWKDSGLTFADTFFIVGIVGKNASTGVNYYMMSPNQMSQFASYLMSTDIYQDMGFGSNGEPVTVLTAKALYNPLQYVTSCFYFPINRSYVSYVTGPVNIKIGPFGVGTNPGELQALTGYTVAGMGGVGADWKQTIIISLPFLDQNKDHPQAITRGKYLRYPPYSRYLLVFPPFGNIPIDPNNFQSTDEIQMDIYFDGVTGKGRLVVSRRFYDTSSSSYLTNVISEHSGALGIPIQMNQVSVDYLNSAIATVDAGTSMLSGIWNSFFGDAGSLFKGVSGAAHGIGNALEAQSPQLLTSGTNGSMIGMYGDTYLECKYSLIVDGDDEDLGRPACVKEYIADVGNADNGGNFIKCAEAHIEFSCLNEERPMILKHLYDGFFFE